MAMTEQNITNGGEIVEKANPGDDNENLADTGPAEMGRQESNLQMTEQSISAQ